MLIAETLALDDPRIEEFLAQQKFLPIQQTPAWARFQESLGVASLRVAVFEDSTLVAFAQIFLKRLPLGFSKLEIPRGPLFQETWNTKHEAEIFELIVAEVEKIGWKQNAVFSRFELQAGLALNSSKLVLAREENFPLATIRLDLTKSMEDLLAEMKPKGRYNIRVAERHGITVTAEKSADTFFALLQKTTARDGFSGHSKYFYQKLLDTLGEDGLLLVASQNTTPLAAILVTFGGDTATYYFGASDHAYRNLMAPYLVQFEAIKIAKERGCKFYDFLGVAPPDLPKHKLAGVSKFKEKFGGELVEYPVPRLRVFRPLLYRIFRLVKTLRP
ncbi:MAG: peptidoglycan bridge formation glycyltransferase FemA/FemB family protein [Candidatus Peribacteraceae bacterium]|nr:peptidoglycan bridge formation glycyltransferase FemA/FemB family protein [Candidatus Peribacteraceae bacterium]